MSLVPIRMTRWSKIATIIRFNGFVLNGNMFVLGLIWGVGYFWTMTWALWPARGIAEFLCAIVSVAIAVTFCWVAWRRRHKFPRVMPEMLLKTAYEQSWPNTPAPTKQKPKRRQERPSR